MEYEKTDFQREDYHFQICNHFKNCILSFINYSLVPNNRGVLTNNSNINNKKIVLGQMWQPVITKNEDYFG